MCFCKEPKGRRHSRGESRVAHLIIAHRLIPHSLSRSFYSIVLRSIHKSRWSVKRYCVCSGGKAISFILFLIGSPRALADVRKTSSKVSLSLRNLGDNLKLASSFPSLHVFNFSPLLSFVVPLCCCDANRNISRYFQLKWISSLCRLLERRPSGVSFMKETFAVSGTCHLQL